MRANISQSEMLRKVMPPKQIVHSSHLKNRDNDNKAYTCDTLPISGCSKVAHDINLRLTSAMCFHEDAHSIPHEDGCGGVITSRFSVVPAVESPFFLQLFVRLMAYSDSSSQAASRFHVYRIRVLLRNRWIWLGLSRIGSSRSPKGSDCVAIELFYFWNTQMS